ncbi:MAG TPA: glucan biosynthesis protein [Steroidobacteraceae bacterium]|nr:glucan biosynthesis protein [Steroidobacteraceae bacterium]
MHHEHAAAPPPRAQQGRLHPVMLRAAPLQPARAVAIRAPSPPARSAQSSPAAPPPHGPARAAPAFNFDSVVQLARARAATPYRNRSPRVPDSLARLNYQQYAEIQFHRSDALWRNQSLFEVQFFHRGFNFDRRVNISEVVNGEVRPVRYNPAWFDFGRLGAIARRLKPDVGFAGFRVHYPLQTPAYKDELIVFLGASYFRMLGRNQVYGLSARGLAVDTASTRGEEFPWFTDFWLVRPAQAQQRSLTIYALLDSQSIAGAYEFDLLPGNITQVTVTSELFPRRDIAKLGIAPLTSMFLYGEDPSGRRFNDYRPEVHDSDGLMMQTGSGEWLWRPLVNPTELRVNRFMDDHPRGFGLVQRDRDFNDYQDTEEQFQRRPSYWVQPLGDWGKGGVELVEIPNDEEIHDNVDAYWVPAQPVRAGRPIKLSYVLSAYLDSPLWPPGGRAIATRTGDFPVNGVQFHTGAQRVMIDYAGGDLDGLDRTQPVQAAVSASGGRVDLVSVTRIAATGAWRVTFRVMPYKPKEAVDLRCYLTLYGEALTETWTYQLPT